MNHSTQNIKDTLNKSVEWMIAASETVTEEKLQAAQIAQRYQEREKIPETYLWMADLYNELTGQEPTKRALLDWLTTFEEWKQEQLSADHLRSAWQQANDINKGFHVGRPGALTVTAVAIKSKTNRPTSSVQINTKAIEQTKQAIAETWDNIQPVSQSVREQERERMLAVRARWAREEAERGRR